jgi:hypothetical protein
MPLAGIGSRFIALLVDYLIWGAVCWCFDSAGDLSAGMHAFLKNLSNGPSRSSFSSFSAQLGLLHAV